MVFALTRKRMGQIYGCRKRVSAVALLDFQASQRGAWRAWHACMCARAIMVSMQAGVHACKHGDRWAAAASACRPSRCWVCTRARGAHGVHGMHACMHVRTGHHGWQASGRARVYGGRWTAAASSPWQLCNAGLAGTNEERARHACMHART